MLTGTVRTVDIDVNPLVYQRWLAGEGLIQDMFPHLTADEREWLLSGVTKEEWNDIIGDEEE
jgi:hypothetical protein